MQLTISDINKAWESKDPTLAHYIITLANQGDPKLNKPIRGEALTFQRFIREIFSSSFRRKTYEEKRAYRLTQLNLLEAADAEVPLAERYKTYQILLLLWTENGFYARQVLLEVIHQLPLRYGAWRALKYIYKEAEANNDYAVLGALAARFDCWGQHEFSHATLIYMRRRAWRYLRKLGESLPACYPEAAIYYLAAYSDDTVWENTWIANHIFYHQSKYYNAHQFYLRGGEKSNKDQRAFAAAWQRSPEPLLRLLTLAQAEYIRQYACAMLKRDFAIALRDIDPHWIKQLASLAVSSEAVDHFIVWLLKNSPRFEQHQLISLELHPVVIGLLSSPDNTAQQYAIDYAMAHARDLSLSQLLYLAYDKRKNITAFVQELISEYHSRNKVDLTAWGILLEITHHYDFAARVLYKHFGRKALTPDWFQARLIQASPSALKFSQDYLLELHPLNTLEVNFFQQVLLKLNVDGHDYADIVRFALQKLAKMNLSALNTDFIQLALMHPNMRKTVLSWLSNERIKADVLPLDFYQALAFEPDWEVHPFIKQLKQSRHAWARDLTFNPDVAQVVRDLLADVRRFSPNELGFEWLMRLVLREEAHYHNFAVNLMIKAFLPADFAPQQATESSHPSATDKQIDKSVDLQQESYLFTGKLKTMTRSEAQAIVKNANGKNASAVNHQLDYLVIGDEGSPLYGDGRKGSKQVKAEALIAAGANMKIISETAFLQRMAGEQREFSDDTVMAGCQALWEMATTKPDTPISKFAIKYFRLHHPDISLAATDRPVDPGAEIPDSFATFARFRALFQHSYAPLRILALDYANYELVRWQPSAADLIQLSEGKYADVREFICEALLAEPNASNQRYRLDANQFEANEVYSFCEAKSAVTRQLGMSMIQQYAKFQLPTALYQLTESTDREMRTFAVRLLWSLYRRYATTPHWKPSLPIMANMTKADKAKREAALQQLGSGLPKRPTDSLAESHDLQQLLQRWLFELPPGRLGYERLENGRKPLSASKAKKALIETCRDIALEDRDFALLILPLLQNFTQSRGKMEQTACLVAISRIKQSHPELLEAV